MSRRHEIARKLPLAVDLDRAEDRATYRDLARHADLIIETEAPGRLARPGHRPRKPGQRQPDAWSRCH